VISTGGHEQAPNAVRSDHGPSWRMIVDLGPEPKAWGIYPGGPSGNPGSPFYDNQLEDWAEGRYHHLLYPVTFSDLAPQAQAFWQFKNEK
jgi:penicillin amidase